MFKSDLDKRICDIEGGDNTQTYREFITDSENEFELDHVNIDDMTEMELNKYLNFLSELGWK